MSERSGGHGASRTFTRGCDEKQVVDHLDAADARGVEVLAAKYIGAREWRILSRQPIEDDWLPSADDPSPCERHHFMCNPTDSKLLDYLDRADYFGIELVAVEFVGGRDWRIVTRGSPIPGPAARRVFHPQCEE